MSLNSDRLIIALDVADISAAKKLVDEIAMQILENKIKPGTTITPTVKGDKIIL